MKRILSAAAITAASTTFAMAGGIDRSGQFLGPLWEEGGESGQYVQFSFGTVSPGAGAAGVPVDPLKSYQQWSLAYKTEFTDKLSFALILDQPFGADVNYGVTSGFAFIESNAITGVARYKFSENFSAHAGIRLQELSGSIQTTVGGIPYRLTAGSNMGVGALVGVAYERRDIALRVALTYNSEISHSMQGTELRLPAGPLAASNFKVTTPASWNLEFQTGIAQNTLLFGSIRHVEWNGFNLTTPGAGQYVNFDRNTTTYSLGIGRRFNENWSGAVTVGYEKGTGTTTTLLAPTSGIKSVGLGVTYTQGNTKVSGGITYGKPGDALRAPAPNFNNNKVIGAGIRVGFNF